MYPMDVAANPLNPNQFAVGMSDGAVHVLAGAERGGGGGQGTGPP